MSMNSLQSIYSFFKFLFLFIFVFVVTSLQAQFDCGEPNSKKAKKAYDEGLQFIERAKTSRTPEFYFNQAIQQLKIAEKADPLFAGIHYYLGYAYAFKPENNIKNALRYFKKSLDLCDVFDIDLYFFLGNIAYADNNLEETIAYFQKYLRDQSILTNDAYIVDAKKILKIAKTRYEILNNPVPFEPFIVDGISSEYNEYLVIITPDDEYAYYTREQLISSKASSFTPEIMFEERFYQSERIDDLNFSNGLPMEHPFNQRKNEGGATLTIDNKELIYTVCEYGTCKENPNYYNCDLYHSKFENAYWNEIKPLPGLANMPCSWESMPSISSDGKVLYFVSDRSGGYGGYDIYKSIRDENNNWGPAINLGPTINSSGNEKSPFIHTDSQTLYFSSDGHIGIGGYDIFFSKLNDNGKWTEPKNIGYPINTEYDDIGFFVSTNGKYGYFASNRIKNLSLGGWDFYSFELYKDARPEKVLFVKGDVKDEYNQVPIDARVEIKSIETKKTHIIPVDSETGKYVVAIPFKSDYVMTVKKEDYVYESVYISAEDTIYDVPANIEVELKPIEIGKPYTMKDIFYEFDSDKLTPNSKLIIEEFVDFMTDNPNISVSINGHTDNIGSAEYNVDLSHRRAKAVFTYLVEKGINSKRLQYKGYGFSRPVASNINEEGRSLNRRTEFVVINK